MALIVKEGSHGRGTFTTEAIPTGALIIPFVGPLLRYAETDVNTYALQIGPDLYIGESGGPDDFINHSCEPNAGFRIQGAEALLYAIRDIRPGEEIFFDYSTTLDEDDFVMVCACGSPSCRSRIGDGKDLPEAVWKRYTRLGIIPDYVRRHREALAR